MFLTKECDYAIRVVRALKDMELVSVGTISEREHIPRQFAYKILKKLKNAGIVYADRGASGGYRLAKNPEDLTIYDIVTTVDENLFLNECLKPGCVCPLNSCNNRCSVHKEFERIQDVLINNLKENTLKSILKI